MSIGSAITYRGKLLSKLYFNRSLLVASIEWGTIAFYDVEANKVLVIIKDIPQSDLLEDVFLTADAQNIIQVNKDGQFFLHDIASGRTVLGGRYVDGEVIIYTPEGYYWSSYEGSHFVHLRFPGVAGIYPFTQFASLLNRPEAIMARLRGRDATTPAPKLVPPPTLELQLGGGSLGGGQQHFRVAAKSVLSTLSRLRVYQDGQLTSETKLSGREYVSDISVHVAQHVRWLTVLAVDEDGLVSIPQAVRLKPALRGSNRLHAVMVGVDTYADPRLTLKYARSDAERLARVLETNAGHYYSDASVARLLDKAATPKAILGALQKAVVAAKPEDTVVFAFAGHGVQGNDGRYYLTPAGYRQEDTPGTGLAWNDLALVLSASKARVIVFLDACHAGLSGSEGIVTNDATVRALLTGARSPMLVFAASKGRQLSHEHPKWGGGVFTFALVEALERKRTTYDLDNNGAIEVSELYQALRSVIAKETKNAQTPWLVRQDLIGNFAVF